MSNMSNMNAMYDGIHVVLDFETLALSHDAEVLALGYAALDMRSERLVANGWTRSSRGGSKHARRISQDTVAWWDRQVRANPKLHVIRYGADRPYPVGVTHSELVDGLLGWLRDYPLERIYLWGYSSLFDLALLRDLLMKECSPSTQSTFESILHRRGLCLRTLHEQAVAMGMEPWAEKAEVPHHPMYDAQNEANMLHACLAYMKAQRKSGQPRPSIEDACPSCGHRMSERAHPRVHWQTTVQGAVCRNVALVHMECDACGVNRTTQAQERANKAAIDKMSADYPNLLLP